MERILEHCVDTLNSRFSIAGKLHFVDRGTHLPVAEITTGDAMARVAVQGGQVLEWQPRGAKPVIWVSKAAVHEAGKGVRGGVPVCWPWFGAKDGKPAHGFVRTRMWEVRETREDHAGSIVLTLGIRDDEATRALWPHRFDLELVVTVGATLRIELVTHNTGNEAFDITQALHTYFHVGDIHRTRVDGLAGVEYLDKVQGFASITQQGAVTFSGETDRVYLDTDADCVIDDPALQRRIRVAKSGSRTSVVWNPWIEKEKGFSDMAAGEYAEMLCVETANAADDIVSVPAGGEARLLAVVAIE